MKKKTINNILVAIILLSIIGFFLSLYLVENHYASPTEGAICDISSTVSCSTVNTSQYSELFKVPVSIFGAIWFAFLGFMAWKGLKKKEMLKIMFFWNILGFLFIIYMIIAEILLKAICPFCTIIHIIILTTLILTYIISKKEKLNTTKIKSLIIAIIIINLIPVLIFNLSPIEKPDYSNLSQCLTENGIKMYGSITCHICAKQKETLGDAFQFIDYIECHPQGKNPQTQLCLEKDIFKTPTWTLEKEGNELNRWEGFQSIKKLSEISGCEING